MPEKKSDLLAAVEYEHRKKGGDLVSRGYQKFDWRGRVHIIQEDSQGRLIGEVIKDKKGNIVKVIEGHPENQSLLNSLVKAITRAKPTSKAKKRSVQSESN